MTKACYGQRSLDLWGPDGNNSNVRGKEYHDQVQADTRVTAHNRGAR
jgi:hypothetical protein